MFLRLLSFVIGGALIAGSISRASGARLSPFQSRARHATAVANTSNISETTSPESILALTFKADGRECTAACAGSVSTPLDSRSLVPKPSSANDGAGGLLLTALAAQPFGMQTSKKLTVGSVELALKDPLIPAYEPGKTTQLLITVRDPAGAVIAGPGQYVDASGMPLRISIGNSSPANTNLEPAVFSGPLPSQGVSNVATITFKGRAHFHYPTFTVSNHGLPALPKGGVTLVYPPSSADNDFSDTLAECITPAIPTSPGSLTSVGGGYYGGPLFGLTGVCSKSTAADIVQTTPSGQPFATYAVNPNHNSDVRLGFGSDKNVYFAYNSAGPNSPTVFGYFRPATVPSGPSVSRLRPENVRNLWRTTTNVSSVFGLTLGNDGSLWFSGIWNGKVTIGKLPPASTDARNWRPLLYTLTDADTVFSIEPGVGNTEALLYSAHGRFYVGTIGTNLTGFRSIRVLANAGPGSGYRLGDLLTGPDSTFYVSATMSVYGNVYKVTGSGAVSTFCSHVQTIYRLSDGTGAGYRDDRLPNEDYAVVHVVPGVGCTAVPVYPHQQDNSPGPGLFGLLGIDTTSEDWLFYNNFSGHRVGIY